MKIKVIIFTFAFGLFPFVSTDGNVTTMKKPPDAKPLHDEYFDPPWATSSTGCPLQTFTTSLTAGCRGPLCLYDKCLTDSLASFNRERIPERVVHAKGCGALGIFTAEHDVSEYTCASLFEVGKITEVVARISTVPGAQGSADNPPCSPRGFALKFKTDCGNWDCVGASIPCFPVYDPCLFPHVNHASKKSPKTGFADPNSIWDFISYYPPCILHFLMGFSSLGLPDNPCHIDCFSINTFKLVNGAGTAHYCRVVFKTQSGYKPITPLEAIWYCGADPDHSIRCLYNAIDSGNYPKWKCYFQIMTFDQAKDCPFNPFDTTKIWPEKDYPCIPVGTLCLNKNPSNYFNDVEQCCFCPSNMVPGIYPSPDKNLQGRMFAYSDAQRYRCGVNFNQIPINRCKPEVQNYERDGTCCYESYFGPNYYRNSFGGPEIKPGQFECYGYTCGDVDRYEEDDDPFCQATTWYRECSEEEQNNICMNMGMGLKGVTDDGIKSRCLDLCHCVDPGLAHGVREYCYS